MSHFYTTKSLGKEWTPSPTRTRYGGTWSPSHEPPALLYGKSNKRIWSRVHERIVLMVFLMGMLGWWIWAGRTGRSRLGTYLQGHWRDTPAGKDIDWSHFAYATYATDPQYLCSSVMLMESLSRLGAKAERILLYDRNFNADSVLQNLLAKAQFYGATLRPIELRTVEVGGLEGFFWASSFTKLLAFNQTEYKRVLSLDSDSTVLQPMDELFLLPAETKIAMPQAYWNGKEEQGKVPELTSALALLTPSQAAFQEIQTAITGREEGNFDMEILNHLYGSSAMILPHRQYALFTGEFKAEDHTPFLGTGKTWDAETALREAKFVHFSDYPQPKPWVPIPSEGVDSVWPKCLGEGGCKDREVWEWLYKDFRQRRKDICGPDFEFQAVDVSGSAAPLQTQEAIAAEADSGLVEVALETVEAS